MSVRYACVPWNEMYRVGDDGSFWSRKYGTWKQLHPHTNRSGYQMGAICHEGRVITKTIHSLVLESFVGPRPKGFHAAHNNGQRDDNRLENLRWATPKENSADRKLHGTYFTGKQLPWTKLTEDDVRNIRAMKGQIPIREMARVFGVNRVCIANIFKGKTWKWVDGVAEELPQHLSDAIKNRTFALHGNRKKPKTCAVCQISFTHWTNKRNKTCAQPSCKKAWATRTEK